MSFMDDLMWDGAGRDLVAERAEMARTAALSDAEGLWPLVAAAQDEQDLQHRLAVAEQSLITIAARRGYSVEELQDDLTARWRLLAEARATVRPAAASSTAQAEQAMDRAVARLAVRAARENPHIPMRECLGLAAEAVRKAADAAPLAWESWGHVADGPFTQRVKHWTPPSLPGSKPGGSAAPELSLEPPKRPSPQVTPTFSHEPGTDRPIPNRGERPAPAPFTHTQDVDTAIGTPRGTAPATFSDTAPAAATAPNPGPAAPATFSDSPATHSPAAPAGPAASGFSDTHAPHITPPRPAGPPSMPIFSG